MPYFPTGRFGFGLPSVQEVLNSPPLKQILDTARQSVIASKAQQALEHMQLVAQQAAPGFRVPTIQELAEHVAGWVRQSESTSTLPVINATGAVFHDDFVCRPLSHHAARSATSLMTDFVTTSSSASSNLAPNRRSTSSQREVVETQLSAATGAEDALVTSSLASAKWLVLSALANEAGVVMARGEISGDGPTMGWKETAEGLSQEFLEVGAVNAVSVTDFTRAVGNRKPLILSAPPATFDPPNENSSLKIEDLVRLGRECGSLVVHDLGFGALLDSLAEGLQGLPSAKQIVATGVDLVVMSATYAIGGPPCGLLLGRKAALDRIRKSPLIEVSRADPYSLAALRAAVEEKSSVEVGKEPAPMTGLLTTSLANLKHRAEKLAPQIARLSAFSNANAEEVESSFSGYPARSHIRKSWAVLATPSTKAASEVVSELRASPHGIVARIHDGRIAFDLRSVFPAQDIPLVSTLLAWDSPTKSGESKNDPQSVAS